MIATESVFAATPVRANAPTVSIVDDDPDVRRSISLLVRSVDLSAQLYSSANEFLEAYNPDSPTCLVLDVRMPGMTGLQLQQTLLERSIQIPIIFITAHGEIPNATAAMRAGAVDFLSKPYSPQLLLDRIHEAIAIDQHAREIDRERLRVKALIAALTEREREVMSLLANGDSTKVISSRLGISPKTVDNHRTKVLEKMGVDYVTQLILLLACLD